MGTNRSYHSSLLSLCKSQLVRSRHCIGDISRVPIAAVDTALSAMNEKELRQVEWKSEQASGIDLIGETWPLWYSIFVRRYGYNAAQAETRAPPSKQLNSGAILKDTERKKHILRMGASFQVPLGDWRQAVDFRVTEAELRLRKSKDALKRANQQLQATLEATKPRKVVPKCATHTLQQRAAIFKVRKAATKQVKAGRPVTALLRGNAKSGFRRR
eukprot:jgi/Ulvmu1/2289/UM013_0136.1